MAKPKKIINDAKDSVEEFIAGLLLQYPNTLAKLENHHVVLSANPPADCVQLLSGGGSGHEPSHAGWIGNGMLSAAIAGGIFASPSVHAILAAIRACAATNNKKGCLLIIKNYTGDRLNFGMACEMANQDGIPCQMVIVADDCALPRTKGITGARGVAGTVLVHKVTGAAAAAGKSLSEIVAVVNEVNSRMGTLGVALNTVTIPGVDKVNDRLDDSTIEIGLGIHGEAGIRQSPLLTSDAIAVELIDTIQKYGRTVKTDGASSIVPMFEKGDELCVLVNNLGGTSNFEMSIFANSCVKTLESVHGCKVTRVLVGAFMTSFDMHGASLTILNLSGASAELVGYLDAECSAPAWLKVDKSTGPRPSATQRKEVVVDESKIQMTLPPLALPGDFESAAKAMALKAAENLAAQEALLTEYDTIVGDGDCGITMQRGATAVAKGVNDGSIPTNHPVTMFVALANAVSASMGGTSGILIELMFRKMSSTLSGCESIGPAELSNAFQVGVDAICLYGGGNVGSRTMLDALVPCAKKLVESVGSLVEAAKEARAGADGTAQMALASAGRSNYLSAEQLMGTPDPGAVAVAIVFEALAL